MIDYVDLVVSGRFHHPRGYVNLSTISAVRTYNGCQKLSSGVLQVAGEGDTAARMVVIGRNCFQIAAGMNGDGSDDDFSYQISWNDV